MQNFFDGLEHQSDIRSEAEVFALVQIVFHFFGQNVTDIHPVGVLGRGQQLFLVLILYRRGRGNAYESDLHARLKRKGLGIRRAGGDVFLVKTGGAKG